MDAAQALINGTSTPSLTNAALQILPSQILSLLDQEIQIWFKDVVVLESTTAKMLLLIVKVLQIIGNVVHKVKHGVKVQEDVSQTN
mgnify:CR=1 FL=1